MEHEAYVKVWILVGISYFWVSFGSALNAYLFSKINRTCHPFKDIILPQLHLTSTKKNEHVDNKNKNEHNDNISC